MLDERQERVREEQTPRRGAASAPAPRRSRTVHGLASRPWAGSAGPAAAGRWPSAAVRCVAQPVLPARRTRPLDGCRRRCRARCVFAWYIATSACRSSVLRPPRRRAGQQRDADADVDADGDPVDHRTAAPSACRTSLRDDCGADASPCVARTTANSSPPSRTSRSARSRTNAAEPVADLLEQVVAGVVPQAVVDLLEPVEVEQQQGDRGGRLERGDRAPGPARRGHAGCPGRSARR